MKSVFAILQKQPYLFPIFATFFWGTNYIFGKIAVSTLPPLHLSFFRWFTAALVLVLLSYSDMKKHLPLFKQHWKLVLSISATGVAAFGFMVYFGLQYTAAINGALINSFQPIVIILFSALILKERVRKSQTLGFTVSIIGFLFLFFHGDIQRLLSLTFNAGDVVLLFSLFVWAIYTVLLKIAGPILPKQATFGITAVIGSVILLPFALLESFYQPAPWHLMTIDFMLIVVYIGIFPTVLAFACWNESVNRLGAAKSSNFLHLTAVFTTIMAVLLGEELNLYHVVGGLLIISGVVMSTNPKFLQLLAKSRSSSESA